MEIERWQRELAKLLDEVLMEIGTMESAKENCERAMESLVTPYDIIVENIAVREGRRQFEVRNTRVD